MADSKNDSKLSQLPASSASPAKAEVGAAEKKRGAAPKAASFKKLQTAVSRLQTFTVTVFRLAEHGSSGDAVRKTQGEPSKSITDGVARTAPAGVASIMMKATDVEIFRLETTLTQVRTTLETKSKVQEEFRFCNEAGAVVPDDSTINDYFTSLANGPAIDDVTFKMYITDNPAPAESLVSILAKPPFILKFIRIEEGKEKTTGTLHSRTMQNKNPSGLAMSEIRKLIKDMSVNPEIDQFCIADGTPVGDDILFEEYLEMTGVEVVRERTPIIPILFHSTARPEKPSFEEASEEVKTALQNLKPDLSFTDRGAEELKADRTALEVKEELDAGNFSVSKTNVKTYTSAMTERDWNYVIRNCNMMYGWRINFERNVLEKAPKPAFKLKEGLNLPPVPLAPVNVHQVLDDKAKMAPNATEEEGYDDATSTDNVGCDDEGASKIEPRPESTKTARPDESIQPADVGDEDGEKEKRPNEAPATSAKELFDTLPSKAGAIPTFQVNDRSKIEVVSLVHQFQESMATNHFSKSSLEVNVSGGWGGNSVGVTGGVAKANSDSKTDTEKATHKRMLASYKFPRVTVYLQSEDLEPTEELKSAIKRIEKSKNINDLRKLRRDFGHIFVQQVVLGGCLQTTKVTDVKEASQEEKSKEEFKAEVGVAVQTVFGVGGSMKASHENQDGKEHVKSNSNQTESMSFEATGGNTLLASNPSDWTTSVADFNNWRVIDQSELVSMVDIISQHPNYKQVKQWFMQAVPKMSEYLVVPDSRTMDVRFKLVANSPTMSQIVGSNIPTYLGHDPLHPPVPRKVALKTNMTAPQIKKEIKVEPLSHRMMVDMTTFCVESKLVTKDAIFFPSGTQAPILFQPTEYKPLDENGNPEQEKLQAGNEATARDKVGTMEDIYLKHTLWSLEVPEAESIGHDSLVCITSQNNSQSHTNRCVLTVYRNAQGVFLPTVSSSDEPSYWRILRAQGPSTEQIKNGEEIRLCWRFSDQPGGYRDYTEDCYGRRRTSRPADVTADQLHLKVPFPSFGGGAAKHGLSLVLSTCGLTEPVWESIKTLKAQSYETEPVMYNLHDLSFRLDSVGNNGLGDSRDYMNHITKAHLASASTKTIISSRSSKSIELGSPIDVLGDVLLGPVIKTTSAILDTFIGWLSW